MDTTIDDLNKIHPELGSDIEFVKNNYMEINDSRKIGKKDKHGNDLRLGDLIAEGSVGEKIWDGQSILLVRPVGLILENNKVQQVKIGYIKDLLENQNDCISNIWLTEYGGKFQGWDNIEKVGSIHDFV